MDRPARWLVAGDLVILLLFSAFGRAAHDLQMGLRGVLATALPFTIAWFVVGAFTGAFRPAAYSSPGSAAGRVVITNVIAVPLAIVMRALWLSRPIPWTFLVVAFTTSLILLLIWRVAFALVWGRRQAAEA